uniref:Fanconi anemia group A protein isoform X1 n=1 Tax=Pogona vitticeps TaxID=103695 RepID=A0A6J0TCP3_9SAUR
MEAAGEGGGGGRALSALLAARSKRRKCAPKTLQKLQEEALHLLSCHQNLDDLLLEVGSSVCDKPPHPTISSPAGGEASVPGLLVVSALQDRAATLGVPVGILSARTAANNVGKIFAEAGDAVFLNAEQREKLSCLLQTLKDLLAQNAFCRLLFAQEMWKMQSPLFLEVAWHLHRENVVSLEDLLEKHPDATGLVEWLSSSLCLLCHRAEELSPAAGPLGSMLTDFGMVFLQNRFKKTLELGKKLESQKLSKVSCAVLERMLAWVLDSVAQEKQEEASKLKAVKCWLHIFSVTAYQGRVPSEALQGFFSHTLTQVLTYNPQLKVSDAVHLQREWCFARTSPVLTMLYRKLFVLFKPEELVHHLQKVLETSEVNWHHVLSCVSTLLVCHSEAEALVKDFLGRLLRKAFEDYDLENMVTAFLIVRQAALEGPAIFVPYSEWFQAAFGSPNGFHSTSKKALVFLFKFLTELVPFEAPQYLKVHIMHPPFVPTKYRPFLLEYIALAKTRLADFKVSIEDMGLYEDLSTAKEDDQAPSQALQDVEKAVQIFENTGKIPASVMEASIFRRPYYASRFLPALLAPRVLPEVPDSHMALIEALKRAEKIPLNAYATYIEGCQAAKETFLQGGSAEMETSGLKEPLELLKAELEALRLLVIDPSKYDGVLVQIAVVSEKLMGVLGRPDDEDDAASLSLRIQLDFSAPEVERPHQEVVDLLLTSFCQTVMSASCFLPPDRQGTWPSLFVKMMAGHRPLLPSLLSRLCQLLCHQGSSLSDAHLIGLAVLAVHLNEAESLLPAVDVGSPPSTPRSGSARGRSFTGLWEYFLVCKTGESVVFCMRFCTVVLSYVLSKFASLSHDDLSSFLHPAFVKKFQYTVPRLFVEARGICYEGSADELPWEALSCPDPCYKAAALCLWKEKRIERLLEEKAFQLTLQEWLLMELGVDPEGDLLSASERRAFHDWALYQHYLPRSSTGGGCDGDLRKACAILIGAILDFCHRSELSKCPPLRNPKCSITQGRGNLDLHCRLQEMLLELHLVRRRPSREVSGREEHFLFQLFQERLKALGNGAAVGERLCRQQELLLQTRILLGLPPSFLVATRRKGTQVTLDCEGFFGFVNTELNNAIPRGFALPYDVTAHFFRGLLSASLECDQPAEEVTAILTLAQARCPIVLTSAARWWPRMEPVLSSEWERLFQGPLAQGLRSLGELQVSVNGFLSSEAASLASPEVSWLWAAFLHFALERQGATEKRGDALKRLGPGAEKVLVYLFVFSILDFITAQVTPQEGVDVQKAFDWSSKVLQCLEERGVPWLAVFSSAGRGHSPGQILLGAVSDQHTKLLPVAFYSLLLAFNSEKLIQEQTFLYVATDMYTQLLQLFMNGPAEVGPIQREQRLGAHKPEDPLSLIQEARRFLLCTIPRCPLGSFTNLQQLLDLCGVLDPEIQAALVDFSTEEDLMDDEPLLF